MRKDARLRFCLAWYIPFWLLFELIPTKLPHYVLPAYPALALLIGWLLAAPPGAADEKLKRWQALLWWATAFGLAVVTLGLAAICIGAPLYLTHAFNFWSIPAAVAVLAAGWLAFPRPAPLSVSRIGAAAAAAGIGYALLFGTIAPSLRPIWLSPRIEAAVRAYRPCETSALAASGYQSRAWCSWPERYSIDRHARRGRASGLRSCLRAGAGAGGQEGELTAALAASGKAAARLAEIDGINYSSGKTLTLGLYHVASQ